MRKASSVLYLIGNIINAIAIVILVILGVLCVVAAPGIDEVPEEMASQYTLAQFQDLAKCVGVFLIIYAIILLIVYILGSKARKAVNNDKKELAPHIIMIVIGVLGSNLLYLIGGILGLASEADGK